jgi:Ca2+-dependent lipid-binding protein
LIVVEAHDVKGADPGLYPKSDPYTTVYYYKKGTYDGPQTKNKAEHVVKTKVIKQALSPVWKEDFEFQVYDPEDQVVFEVLDEDMVRNAFAILIFITTVAKVN